MQDVEWGPAKDASNRHEHGIAFGDAATDFGDPYRIVEDRARPNHGEERRKTIGRMDAVVVAISRDRDGRRRIIFAPRARQDERRRYDQGAATG